MNLISFYQSNDFDMSVCLSTAEAIINSCILIICSSACACVFLPARKLVCQLISLYLRCDL